MFAVTQRDVLAIKSIIPMRRIYRRPRARAVVPQRVPAV